MDSTTPTMSGDEESGTTQQQPTTEKQEQPAEETATTTNNKQQEQPLDDVVVVDVTKPSTDKPKGNSSTKAKTAKASASRRFDKVTLVFFGLVLVGLLVAAITIPIVKNNQKKSRSTSTSGLSVSEGGEDPSNPDGTPAMVDGSAPTAGGTPATATTTSPGFEPLWPGVSDSIGFYDESVVQGYKDKADLQKDLEAVAKMMINLVVARNTGSTSFGNKYNYGTGSDPEFANSRQPGDDTAAAAPSMPEEGGAADGNMPMPVMAPSMPAVGSGVNDFGSNNQEDNVEEGDKIVSDGTRVFASYGDYIIAWDVATGKQLAMAPMEKFGPAVTAAAAAAAAAEKAAAANASAPVDATMMESEADTRMYMPPYYYEPKPTIMSLLLVGSRLVVAVDGGYQTHPVEPMMSNVGQTRVLVYETESLTLDPSDGVTVMGEMTPLFSRDYNGMFVAFRAIGENLHTVVTSQINTYTALVGPVERYTYEYVPSRTLTDQEYMARVKTDAEGKLIPNFVAQLTKELTLPDGSLPKLARISKFLTHTSEVNPQMDQYFLYDNGIINSVTLVQSMNIFDDEPATSSAAGIFLPSYSSQVYSSQEYMIIAGQGYDYSPARMASTESTYLTAMKLDGDSSAPYSIGVVEGSFLNQRSFDVVGNVLRFATTIQNFWMWQPMPMPMPMMETDVVVAEGSDGAATSTANTSDAAEEPLVLATDESGGGDSTAGGSDATLVFVDIPEPAPVEDPPMSTMPIQPTQSTTENYIITLKLPSEDEENHGMMQELGRIKLGKPHETFTSVRFFDNVAYAVTFQRRDPFYVLNVTDPKNLQILAEVNITGFSSYLHSMNDENNMILAIGQEADEFGTVLGLQISMFDVRDVKDIKVLRHTIETDPNVYSDTAGMWDVMAIRFNRETGRLIIPVDMSNWQNPSQDFHGFRVYSVTETAIQEDENCRVQMGNANQMTDMCFYCASLEPRAMIMKGDMMLTKSHFVKSIDMNNCTTNWEFAVNSTYDPTTGCCGYY